VAEFCAVPEDFDEIIRKGRRAVLRRQSPYPLTALAASIVLSFVQLPAALVALGMFIAWGVSTFLEWRAVRAMYLWRFAWAQEESAIEVEVDGIRLTNQRGSGFIRWSSGANVRAHSTCFVLEDEGEEVAVIPKRYLNATELLLLRNRAEADASTAPNPPLQPTSGAGASG
jgi:hypothetical protein